MATDRIGSYIIESVVGEGAFGRVLRGRHEASGYVRALKVPRAAAYLGNFAEEARLLDRLVHPNVVRFYEFHLGDPAYLVFEYVEGENLAQRLKRGPLPWREAVGIVEQLLDGLQAAHDLGIFHRDLKPANILRGRDGEVKIADFGLGRVVAEVSMEAGRQSLLRGTGVTTESLQESLGEGGERAAESLAGTWAYMSPEQQQGKPADARSDLYAVGVLFYEMLTGQRPEISRDMPPPSELVPSAPHALDELVLSCFNRPDRRLQTAREFWEVLQSLVERELARHPVVCPECGVFGEEDAQDQFTCPRCGRQHLCVSHRDAHRGLCGACAQALAEEERRQREAEEERKREAARRAEAARVEAERRAREEQAAREAALRADEERQRRQAEERIWATPPVAAAAKPHAAPARSWLRWLPAVGGVAVGMVLLVVLVVVLRGRSTSPLAALTERQKTKTVTLPGGATLDLVWVPGGSFPMGSEDGDDDEKPVHRVELDGFWIGKTEVTVGQWRSAMGGTPGDSNDQGDDHPVVDVSWDDCVEFCRKANLSLPTEAQWEYAARGPEAQKYPWGNGWDKSLCQSGYDRHGHDRTAPVGSFPGGASWCDALDMAGNVWEWCRDWYQADFYATSEAAQSDPECTNNSSSRRVLRGGGWLNDASFCRSALRVGVDPDSRCHYVGFRVSQDAR